MLMEKHPAYQQGNLHLFPQLAQIPEFIISSCQATLESQPLCFESVAKNLVDIHQSNSYVHIVFNTQLSNQQPKGLERQCLCLKT